MKVVCHTICRVKSEILKNTTNPIVLDGSSYQLETALTFLEEGIMIKNKEMLSLHTNYRTSNAVIIHVFISL